MTCKSATFPAGGLARLRWVKLKLTVRPPPQKGAQIPNRRVLKRPFEQVARFRLARPPRRFLYVAVRIESDRGYSTSNRAEGVDRINAATRPKGRGGGGVCPSFPFGGG